MNTILIIDDDLLLVKIYTIMLEERYRVITAHDSSGGMEKIIFEKPDCVILDNMLPGGSGFQMLNDIRRKVLDAPPIIFMSSSMDPMLRENAAALGAFACFEKGEIHIARFNRVIEEALHAH